MHQKTPIKITLFFFFFKGGGFNFDSASDRHKNKWMKMFNNVTFFVDFLTILLKRLQDLDFFHIFSHLHFLAGKPAAPLNSVNLPLRGLV